MKLLALAVLTFVIGAQAHITLVPNVGAASGGYFATSIKIPHGERGMHTKKFVLHVPRGIASIRPEVPPGWNVDISTYQLAEEDRYTSHGRQITEGPDQVTWTANSFEAALYTDHLMMIAIQLKLMCSFNDPVKDDYTGSNSMWEGERTLWFKIEQHSTVDDISHTNHTAKWTGALMDDPASGASPPWNPPSDDAERNPEKLKACPYLFIHAGTRCSIDHSGEPKTGGMNWMGTYVEAETNPTEILQREHVKSLANEAALTALESHNDNEANTARINALTDRMAKLEDDDDKRDLFTLNLAVGALAISALAMGIIFTLCLFRVANRKQFAHSIAGVPLLVEHPVPGAGKV